MVQDVCDFRPVHHNPYQLPCSMMRYNGGKNKMATQVAASTVVVALGDMLGWQ